MSEIILQSIVEKLESIEIALLKPTTPTINDETNQAILNEVNSFRIELKNNSASVKISNEKANEILLRLDAHTRKLDEPVKDNIKYHHYLHKGLWVSLALFVLSILLLMGWVNSYNSKKQYEANDIKYRSLKINAGPYLIKTFYNMDSSYNADAEAVRKKTIQEEDRLAEQTKLLRLAGEKENEAEELKMKAKEK